MLQVCLNTFVIVECTKENTMFAVKHWLFSVYCWKKCTKRTKMSNSINRMGKTVSWIITKFLGLFQKSTLLLCNKRPSTITRRTPCLLSYSRTITFRRSTSGSKTRYVFLPIKAPKPNYQNLLLGDSFSKAQLFTKVSEIYVYINKGCFSVNSHRNFMWKF